MTRSQQIQIVSALTQIVFALDELSLMMTKIAEIFAAMPVDLGTPIEPLPEVIAEIEELERRFKL